MRWGLAVFGFLLLAPLVATGSGKGGPTPTAQSAADGLSIHREATVIRMVWNGPIMPPMLERFEQAFGQLKFDTLPIVISFNSPGGLVVHGHHVINAITRASRSHPISTRVDAGKQCASMCVPIYMASIERSAHPTARFMFHEASLRLPPDAERDLRAMNVNVAQIKKKEADRATDALFNDDFLPQGGNAKWFEAMRKKIKNRDVWLSARELVEQHAGVVDKLE